MMNLYWESGSFPQGDIASGPQPKLAALTMKLAAKNSWRISFEQQQNKRSASWRRYKEYKIRTTTTATLANECTMADLIWDWKHNFVEIFDPQTQTLLIPRSYEICRMGCCLVYYLRMVTFHDVRIGVEFVYSTLLQKYSRSCV
jgi:hypothetical protein